MTPYSKQALEIGEDLAVIEEGFVRLWKWMPLRGFASGLGPLHLAFGLEPLPLPEKRPYIAKPDMPRCRLDGKHRPCRNPATYPGGLCPSHFIWTVGHSFIHLQNEIGYWTDWVRCELCGSGHPYSEHARHPSLKERCPGRRAKKK